ncbi:MAG: hypothetical protein WAX77_00660 [Methylococcaceae bacterium]
MLSIHLNKKTGFRYLLYHTSPTALFTNSELQILSSEIDQQLSESVQNQVDNYTRKHTIKDTKKIIPAKQKQQLEEIMKEEADSFMKKFARAAKKDLCSEGGVLHEQWKKYGDLDNKETLKTVGTILLGMGVSSAFLQAAVVAVSTIILHVGIKAFCEDCE